ncbi:MAG: MotA/TolQ/ExbB proton channel family protein [Elusimicrobiota bacterium]
MGDMAMWQMALRSFSMWILIITSIISLTFFIERWLHFSRLKHLEHDDFMRKIKDHIQKGSIDLAIKDCRQVNHPLCRVVEVGLKNFQYAREEIYELITGQISKEQLGLEKNLGVLGTISNIAPMLGLFGTISGIIRAFRDIGMTGSGGSSVIAIGVSEALVATAFGILIAVVATIFYNYFSRRVAIVLTQLEVIRQELLVWLRKHDELSGSFK